MALSARNQLAGTVTAIKEGGVMVVIKSTEVMLATDD